MLALIATRFNFPSSSVISVLPPHPPYFLSFSFVLFCDTLIFNKGSLCGLIFGTVICNLTDPLLGMPVKAMTVPPPGSTSC